jgi:hypothetical protein
VNLVAVVPRGIVLLVAGVLIVAMFVPPLEPLREEFSLFFDIIAAFAFVLGGASLIGRHGRKIRHKTSGYGYSLVCLAAFGITLVAGLLKLGNPAGIGGDVTARGSVFAWIVRYIFGPADSGLFALLAFFIASAAFRAFRVRSREATIMLVTAFLLLLGRTFLGALVTSWLPDSLETFELPNVIPWIMSVPLKAGSRAILIGVAIGAIATSLRIILGIDRPYRREGE